MSIYDPAGDRMIVTYGASTWALSLGGDPAWTEIATAGAAPPARHQGSAIYDPVHRRLVLFGGEGAGRFFHDAWALTLGSSPEWIDLAPSGTPPSGRGGQAAVYDSARDRMVIYSGGVTYDDCAGGLCSCSPEYKVDAWSLELRPIPQWTKLQPGGGVCGVTGHGVNGHPVRLPAIYDPLRDRMIIDRGNLTSALVWGAPPLPVSVDLDPDVVNLTNRGRWLTAYVETSELDLSSVRLQGSVAIEEGHTAVGDRDGDGIPELMIKFPRAAVDPLLHPGTNLLEVTGSLRTGERFQGTDRVRVISSRSD